jgi:hypothetical protein
MSANCRGEIQQKTCLENKNIIICVYLYNNLKNIR